jgi:hypothetical protein
MRLCVLFVSAFYGHRQLYRDFYNHSSFCLLNPPTLANVYTLGVCCAYNAVVL